MIAELKEFVRYSNDDVGDMYCAIGKAAAFRGEYEKISGLIENLMFAEQIYHQYPDHREQALQLRDWLVSRRIDSFGFEQLLKVCQTAVENGQSIIEHQIARVALAELRRLNSELNQAPQ